jgi:hypothetical protein
MKVNTFIFIGACELSTARCAANAWHAERHCLVSSLKNQGRKNKSRSPVDINCGDPRRPVRRIFVRRGLIAPSPVFPNLPPSLSLLLFLSVLSLIPSSLSLSLFPHLFLSLLLSQTPYPTLWRRSRGITPGKILGNVDARRWVLAHFSNKTQ